MIIGILVIIDEKDIVLIEKSFRIESYKKQKEKMQQLTLIFDNIDTSKRGLSGFMDIVKK
ncbi:hypothetical protein JL780_12430 [Staphylococcus pseudintermedius]|uniref:hypothetical protein n=1 Tax=Staphylococcus shinii TaxID=2912228 RepID=UPI000E1BB819|nr:hypothetical protein [Staphylococcus pseudintermedius]QDX54743.1 hypothetical protein DNI27_05370 [Staphylococcus pseudintermedius]QDX61343.1 hypothetical protein DRC71_01205 [Staphylococcus pseudintermedius]TPD27123.1 hypothetical protein DJ449_00135 [Staphylococcus pseudintermedius]